MLHKTEAIAINYLKYSETSIIVRLYTHKFGMQSYIVNGVRSVKAKYKIALFQPLTQLELVSYHNLKSDLQRFSEIRCSVPYQTLNVDHRKICTISFITELLYKTLPQENSNPELFDFLATSFLFYDLHELYPDTFHLKLMIHLFPFLGFQPSDIHDILSHSTHKLNLNDPDLIKYLENLLQSHIDSNVEIPIIHCKLILTLLLDFLMFNMPQLSAFKSISVLAEL